MATSHSHPGNVDVGLCPGAQTDIDRCIALNCVPAARSPPAGLPLSGTRGAVSLENRRGETTTVAHRVAVLAGPGTHIRRGGRRSGSRTTTTRTGRGGAGAGGTAGATRTTSAARPLCSRRTVTLHHTDIHAIGCADDAQNIIQRFARVNCDSHVSVSYLSSWGARDRAPSTRSERIASGKATPSPYTADTVLFHRHADIWQYHHKQLD